MRRQIRQIRQKFAIMNKKVIIGGGLLLAGSFFF
jgi:hypothetical protein